MSAPDPFLFFATACTQSEAPQQMGRHPATHDQVYAALRAAGAEQLTELVFDDDHSFSANRIELAGRLVDWQQTECWR